MEKEKKDEYYKSLSQKIMIKDILSINDNAMKVEKLIENKNKLENQFHSFVKVYNSNKKIFANCKLYDSNL